MMNGVLITDREEYFKQQAIDRQRRVVNYKSSSTLTSEALVWTYRTTNCDVISVITTTVPVRDGSMKDINMRETELKRLKPPANAKKLHRDPLLNNSPFEFSLSVNAEQQRSKINEVLISEKNDFMRKLTLTRMVRSKLEHDAARRVQAIYRGYSCRSNLPEIRHFAEVHKMMRQNIRAYLEVVNYPSLALAEFRKHRQSLRHDSATLIKCVFLRFLSKKCFHRRKLEQKLCVRNNSAVRIQSLLRGWHSRRRLLVLLEMRQLWRCTKAATMIQCALRGLFARRKVRHRWLRLRWLAARMIQSWYRAKYSRRMAAHIKNIMTLKRKHTGAEFMQCVVRAFLAKRRVQRIRYRRLYLLVHRSTVKIQTLARRFLARHTVQRKRIAVRQSREDEQRREEKQAALVAEDQRQIEAKALLESADLFLQARHGKLREVEDIFNGALGGEEHTVFEEDMNGDTLLTITAALGHLDLVRRALLWGFGINHRNSQGMNAAMVAARGNHYPVLQYLLSFLPGGDNATNTANILQLNTEDIGYLFTAAAANSVGGGNELQMLQLLISQSSGGGWDVNSKAAGTGTTAMHAACEVGNLEAFKLLHKHKAKLEDVYDEQGQSPLHRAVTSSVTLTQWILGLDPHFQIYMAESNRVAAITKVDSDGKDCLLLATLAGQNEVLDVLDACLEKAGEKTAQQAQVVDIGWSPNDINRAIVLVERGNLYCLRRLVTVFGYDPNWPQDETGITLALAACRKGDTDMIDLLMDLGADFALRDSLGRCVMHYAATHAGCLAHLLSHTQASKRGITPTMLLWADQEQGENACHYAARDGVELNIDLLAGDSLGKALAMPNKVGMTPLLLACAHHRSSMITQLVKSGAEPLAFDGSGHNALWHLFHPMLAANGTVRKGYCAEPLPSSSTADRKEKDEEAARLAQEVGVVAGLLKAGCELYGDYSLSPAKIRALPDRPTVTTDPGDIIIQESLVSLLRAIVPTAVSQLDSWRLLIGAIRFDSDGSMKVLSLLWKLGLLEALAADAHNALSEEASIESAASAFSRAMETTAALNVSIIPPATVGASVPAAAGTNTRRSMAVRQSVVAGVGHSSGNNVVAATAAAASHSAAVNVESSQLARMQGVFFQDFNLTAWAVALGHSKLLQYLLRRGVAPALPVDYDGHPLLHFVALRGTVEMVDIIISADKKLRLEAVDKIGHTAAAIAVRADNFKVAKRLFELRGNPRRALLLGGYKSWALAFVRRYEQFEINTQTGRSGEDDDKYFNTAPNPSYTMWYGF